MFFKVWQNNGLQQAPRIELIETKQIIPDKSLFGKSNFAENAFSVIIQLGMGGAPDPSHLNKQSNQTQNNKQEKIDINMAAIIRAGSGDPNDVVNPVNTRGKSGERYKNTEGSYSDDSVNHATSGGNVIAGESVGKAVEDPLELALENDEFNLNRERNNTNAMDEGHNAYVTPGGA